MDFYPTDFQFMDPLISDRIAFQKKTRYVNFGIVVILYITYIYPPDRQ